MKLYELITKEYILMVESLELKEDVENNRILIDKEHFRKLLEKYAYMSFREKVKIYKDLNFIIHDKNNYTLPCRDLNTKKTVRKVVINYNTYTTLKTILEKEVNT